MGTCYSRQICPTVKGSDEAWWPDVAVQTLCVQWESVRNYNGDPLTLRLVARMQITMAMSRYEVLGHDSWEFGCCLLSVEC